MTELRSEVRILGVPIRVQRFDAAVDELLSAAATGARLRVHFATVHSVVEAARSAELMQVFETAEMVCADGMPLVWVSRLRGGRGSERVCGPDLMLALADKGRDKGLRHYFLGGVPGTPEALARELGRRYPGMNVVGGCSPPFDQPGEQQVAAMLDEINRSAADVVWVGLGAPKQELWAARHRAKLRAALVLPVGAAFDFHSGRRRRAPRWMRRAGLEWLFRLASEPRRLGPRYVSTNIRFIWLLLTERVVRRSRP